MAVGIIGYGAQIPRRRIKVEEIAKVWGADAPSYKQGLGLREKSVPGLDEDSITLAVGAARNALARAQIDPQDIGAVVDASSLGKDALFLHDRYPGGMGYARRCLDRIEDILRTMHTVVKEWADSPR